MDFKSLCAKVNIAKKVEPFHGTILALDPGETTGWALFENQNLVKSGQISTWPMKHAVSELSKLLLEDPTHVVYEQYRVYSWKSDDHKWSNVPTLHIIGCIETLSILRGNSYSDQSAQVAKNFCTDEKLQRWDFYKTGERHARDAIRHGCYYLLFGPSK